jgi:signal transduction histidine kinase
VSDRQEIFLVHRRFVVWEATSVIRHDLRGKLSSVRNAAFYLQRRVAAGAADLVERDNRITKFFDLIPQEIMAAEAVLGARLPGFDREPEVEPFDVREVVISCVASCVDRPGCTVSIMPSAQLALGCRSELAVAIYCLVENALDAVAERGGGLVTVSCHERDDHTVIEVIDDGPGLSSEAAARALEHFFTTKPGRLGLGLNIARRTAARSRGTLELGTTDARGARAAIVLPRMTAPNPP